MSKIMAVNAGSSSLKFQLIEMSTQSVITSGIVERIGFEDAKFVIEFEDKKEKQVLPIFEHTSAVQLVLKALIDHNIVASLDEIEGVGHRVVHGGEKYSHSVVLTDEVEADIASLNALAPLHNPANLVGYHAFKAAMPKAGHVAVFDTAFHQTMDRKAYIYGLPYAYYEKYAVRKYGFHGTSHQFVSKRMNEIMGNKKDSKVIVCHLGNGASICAIKDGISIDTSMGFTPLAGVMMGTRSGDIDPAILPYVMEKENLTIEQMIDVCNKASGMLGVSQKSSDARDIEDAIAAHDPLAILTLEIYAKRIADYIGSYIMRLGGVDAIVFTAGIGENAGDMRLAILNDVKDALGIVVDLEANKSRGKEVKISTDASNVLVYVIPTNEELVIAQDTVALLNL